MDLSLTETHSATLSFSVYPEKLAYLGLNTFTPQESTPDLHQHGYQTSLQDRYVLGTNGLVTSQINYQKYDADLLPNSTAPYRLLLETTEGGFFDRQNRRSDRYRVAGDLPIRRAAFSGNTHSEGGHRLFAQRLRWAAGFLTGRCSRHHRLLT